METRIIIARTQAREKPDRNRSKGTAKTAIALTQSEEIIRSLRLKRSTAAPANTPKLMVGTTVASPISVTAKADCV